MKFTKNASLNLSINAIVILILAITMLGLGLTFMRGLFKKTTGQLSEVGEDIEAKVIEDVEKSGAKLTFTKKRLTMERSQSKQVYFGIKNQLVEDKLFHVYFGCYDTLNPEADFTHIGFEHPEDTARPIRVGDVKVMAVNIVTNPDATLTSYTCEVVVVPDGETVPTDPTSSADANDYSRVEFFVTVE